MCKRGGGAGGPGSRCSRAVPWRKIVVDVRQVLAPLVEIRIDAPGDVGLEPVPHVLDHVPGSVGLACQVPAVNAGEAGEVLGQRLVGDFDGKRAWNERAEWCSERESDALLVCTHHVSPVGARKNRIPSSISARK